MSEKRHGPHPSFYRVNAATTPPGIPFPGPHWLVLLLLHAAGVLSIAAESLSLPDAAEKKDWPGVESLLVAKADPNGTQADGMTALHWAAHHDHAGVAQKLLAAGANVNAANRYGVTPLSLACQNGSELLVTALLDAGAGANTEMRGGESVLMTAARTGRPGPVAKLLAKGARIEAKDRKGQTAIVWAAAEGHEEVINLLIKSGADFRAPLKSGFTPLLFAAREGRIGAVRTLLKAGADANVAIVTEQKSGGREPSNGTGALLLAVENGHFELAMMLVKAGANPNDLRSGFTPLHVLSWVRKPGRGDDLDGQPPPAGSGNLTSLEFARQIIAAGADVNFRLTRGESGAGKLNRNGATPLLLAAKTADLELMKLFVELGADPLTPNADGATPLMAAAGLGCYAPDEEAGTEAECLEAVTWLLSRAADVNTVDRNGETAMHGAAYKSLPGMVKLLAARGAKMEVWNHKNKYGWSPQRIAEGFRPGNFKPSVETLEALQRVTGAAGTGGPTK